MQFVKKLSKHKVVLLCLALVIVLFPKVGTRPAESEIKAVVSSIGIDITDDKKVEVSLNIITPKTSNDVDANLHTIHEKGDTINQALINLSYTVGRFVGLAHCESVVLNKNVLKEDATKYIDFIVRTNNLTTNSLIFIAETSAKEVLTLSTKVGNPHSQSIKNIIEYNENIYLPIKMNVENFYKAYFSPQGVAVMGVIGVKDLSKDEEGDESSGGGESGGSGGNASSSGGGDQNISSENANSSNSSESQGSGGGGGKEEKVLYNKSDLAIIKKGRLIKICSEDERKILNLINEEIKRNFLIIKDIDINPFYDATITFKVFEKKNKIKYFFNNDIPVVLFDLTLFTKIDEVNSNIIDINEIDEISNYLYPEIKENLILNVKKEFSALNEFCLKENVDIFAVFDNFYKFHNKKWNKYLNNLSDDNTYLKNVLFEMKINIINSL